MTMKLVPNCALIALVCLLVTGGAEGKECARDSDCSKQLDCRCSYRMASTEPFVDNAPQLVMLTFDDAVTVANFPTYKELFERRHKRSGCPVQATFFVTHEYTNYQLVHELHRRGHEIAVHSISHKADTEFWKRANESIWKSELFGMKRLLSKFAQIPLSDIVGVRVPFLQTSGNDTFKALYDDSFLYDASMPSRLHMSPALFPYTLDGGFQQDCQIGPCPESSYPGLWIVPMINQVRIGEDRRGNPFESLCAMADACVPQPATANETFEYLRENFLRHYEDNKAPFPLFLHEAWLKDDERFKGYFQFVDWLLEKEDVFLVSIQEVIEWMKEPRSAIDYEPSSCSGAMMPKKTRCMARPGYGGKSCEFRDLEELNYETRYMTVCGTRCPRNYPWVGNPLGE